MFEWTNFAIGLLGLLASIYAIYVAHSAKTAVADAVNRKDAQHDRDRLRDLVKTLGTAKEAAMRRRQGAAKHLASGHRLEDDVHLLQQAEDALRTKAPFNMDAGLQADIKGAAADLKKAMTSIRDTSDGRDGWGDALSTLQAIIPRTEQAERDSKNKELLIVAS